MSLDYDKVWETMNDLEMITSKIVSAREIIDTATEAIQRREYDKAETLATAAYEFLGYYLNEFDEKFKLAWKETVVKQKEENKFGVNPWSYIDFGILDQDTLQYTEEELNAMCDKAKSDEEKEKCREYNLREAEYYDKREELSATYDDMIASGYTMTDDGFWIPPQKEDKVVKWQLPIEIDGASGEYYVIFPDDLLDVTDLKEGDQVQWIDRNDGSFEIRKVTELTEEDVNW